MKIKTKILSAFIAGAVTVTSFGGVMPSVVPETGNYIQVNADDVNTDTSGTCGENITWELDSEGTLTISGSGDMANYEYDGSPFYERTDIKNVIISDGVTGIGENVFYKCTALASVNIPESVTSIGKEAFYNCSGLTSVTIPDLVTIIGGWTFHDCSGLTSVTIPNSVTSIERFAFVGCSALKSITIPDSVKIIDFGAFNDCTSLTSVTIPDSVTSIDSVFINCSDLTDITIRNPECEIGDTPATISNGFNNDTGYFYNGTIHGYKNSTAQAYAEKYGYKFASLDDDPAVTAPNAVIDPVTTTTTVTADKKLPTEGTCGEGLTWKLSDDGILTISGKGEMDHSFSYSFGGGYSSPWKGRTDIKSVVVEKGVLSISYESFENCTALESVTLPEGLKSIGDTFEGCTSLKKMNIPDSVEYLAWHALLDTPLVQNQTGDVAYVGNWVVGAAPGVKNAVFREGTTDIAMGMFKDCSELETVTFPDSLRAIHVLDFYNCDSLTSVTIPKNVKVYDDVFGDCDNLKEVTISEGCSLNAQEDCGGRTMVSFFNCENLEKVTVLEDNLSELWFGKDWSDEYGGYQDISNITIYGHSGTQTEKTAKEKGYKFEVIDDTSAPVGDANGDGKLNVRDAAYIAKMLAQGKADELPESADFNGDGNINVRDAAAIAKFLATGKK